MAGSPVPRLSRRGITLIELLVVLTILSALIGLLLPAVQQARAAAAARVQCQNHLRQVALGMHHHHDARGSLPAGVVLSAGPGRWRLTGWGVALLPFLDQQPVFDRAADFARSPTFAGPVPHAGLDTVIRPYTCPADDRVTRSRWCEANGVQVAFTSFLGVCGTTCPDADGVLFADSRVGWRDVTDGTGQTLLLGERPPSPNLALGWWNAGDGQYHHGEPTGTAEGVLGVREWPLEATAGGGPCPPGRYRFRPTAGTSDPCGVFHYWSLHPGGANFAFCDGSARFLPYAAEPVLSALSTRAGGEAVGDLP